MKNLAIVISLVAIFGALLGIVKWRQARRAKSIQALLDQAEKSSGKIATYAEKEYGPLGSTTDEILSHESDDKAGKVLLALLYRIGQKSAKHGIENLTRTERLLPAVSVLDAEVQNGGFDQYFFNPGSDESETALEGLKEIGASDAAGLLERALAVFPDGKPPTDREKRWKAMDRISSKAKPIWNTLENEFYGLKENISELSLAYAKRKRAEITLP